MAYLAANQLCGFVVVLFKKNLSENETICGQFTKRQRFCFYFESFIV